MKAFYAVCRLVDRAILYAGFSARACAEAWEPGSVWGRGWCKDGAILQAQRKAGEVSRLQAKAAARWN